MEKFHFYPRVIISLVCCCIVPGRLTQVSPVGQQGGNISFICSPQWQIIWTLLDTREPNLGKCRRFKHHVLPSFQSISVFFSEQKNLRASRRPARVAKFADPTGSFTWWKWKPIILTPKFYYTTCVAQMVPSRTNRGRLFHRLPAINISFTWSQRPTFEYLFLSRPVFPSNQNIKVELIDLIQSSGNPFGKGGNETSAVKWCQNQRADKESRRKRPTVSKSLRTQAMNQQLFVEQCQVLEKICTPVPIWTKCQVTLSQLHEKSQNVQTPRWRCKSVEPTIQQLKQQPTFMMTYGYTHEMKCATCVKWVKMAVIVTRVQLNNKRTWTASSTL